MEKPRKKEPELNDTCTVEYACAYNNAIDAMSTWLEGEVPTVEQIENILMKQELRSANDVAKEIHFLITRKLIGK